jgi:hypothetical protein
MADSKTDKETLREAAPKVRIASEKLAAALESLTRMLEAHEQQSDPAVEPLRTHSKP